MKKIILAHVPELKKYSLKGKGSVYVDSAQAYDVPKTIIKRPKLGKRHRIFTRSSTQEFPALMINIDPEYKIFLWYEDRLPKVLKKSGLDYRLRHFPTVRKGQALTAPVYELEARSLAQFARRPRRAFATHRSPQKDTHTLAELSAAAQKFGLNAQQVTVVHAELSKAPGHTGFYDAATDSIQLTAQNLGLLGHEGLHRLLARKLIPPQEYHALVQAGQALAHRNPKIKDYIEQIDSTGSPVYKPGLIRDHEYAAVFAENYYTRRPALQKYLADKKLTNFERLIDYLQELLEIPG